MLKGMENCARKWCLFLCTILFMVTLAFGKMCSAFVDCHMWKSQELQRIPVPCLIPTQHNKVEIRGNHFGVAILKYVYYGSH